MDFSISKDITITMLGGGATGKSSITVRKTAGHFLNVYDPTIEDSYRTAILINKNKPDEMVVPCQILDTAGQEEFSALRDSYIRSGSAYIMVCSLISKNTLAELSELLEQIKRILDIDTLNNIPIVIAANKCDLTEKIEINDEDLNAISDNFKIPYLKTSAKNNVNIDELFEIVLNKYIDIEKQKLIDNPELVEIKKKKKRKCLIL